MANSLSKSQINKLGERLRSGATEDDLRLLSEYRDSHDVALEDTIADIFRSTQLVAVGRPKSNQSIIEKLLRQSTRLSQMQDIAGCRLVVDGPLIQQKLLEFLQLKFDGCEVNDRRVTPSHGYRAVHIIRQHPSGRFVEIQIRTKLQDIWAQCSERLADLHGIEVKYGGGPAEVVSILQLLSELVAEIEAPQMSVSESIAGYRASGLELPDPVSAAYRTLDDQLERLERLMRRLSSFVVSSRQQR